MSPAHPPPPPRHLLHTPHHPDIMHPARLRVLSETDIMSHHVLAAAAGYGPPGLRIDEAAGRRAGETTVRPLPPPIRRVRVRVRVRGRTLTLGP